MNRPSPVPLPDAVKFWAKTARVGDCLEWQGQRHPVKGYGSYHVRRGFDRTAHRLAWALVNGPIPDGMQVLHSCDNPPCVEPTHLRLGTNAENVADRQERGRQAVGERHGWARLTPANVRAIRVLREDGRSQQTLASMFGVSRQAIRGVLNGSTWTHVV